MTPRAQMPLTTAERDALAAKYFPEQWAQIAFAHGESKARQKLRRAAEDEHQLEGLRAEGRSCASCASFNTRQIPGLNMKAHCDYESDFQGYVEARPNGLCIHWRLKP